MNSRPGSSMNVSPEHLIQQARERFAMQDYRGAAFLLEEVVAGGRAFADVHHLLGVSYSLLSLPAKALAEWNGLGPDLAVREGQTLLIPAITAPAPNPEPVPTAPGLGSPTQHLLQQQIGLDGRSCLSLLQAELDLPAIVAGFQP